MESRLFEVGGFGGDDAVEGFDHRLEVGRRILAGELFDLFERVGDDQRPLDRIGPGRSAPR